MNAGTTHGDAQRLPPRDVMVGDLIYASPRKHHAPQWLPVVLAHVGGHHSAHFLVEGVPIAVWVKRSQSKLMLVRKRVVEDVG